MISRNRYYECAFNHVNGSKCRGTSCLNCVRSLGFDINGVVRCKCNGKDCGTCKDWVSDKAGKSSPLCDKCARECKRQYRTYCNLFEESKSDPVFDLKPILNYIRYADAYRRKFYKR